MSVVMALFLVTVWRWGRPLSGFIGAASTGTWLALDGFFFAKSAESLEKKRIEFCACAKERKRVRKNVKRKNLSTVTSDERLPGCARPLGQERALLGVNSFQNGNCWYTPREFSYDWQT